MRRFLWLTLVLPVIVLAQYVEQKQPPPYQPTPSELAQIRSQLGQLNSLLAGRGDPDVAIYAKAVTWILRHPEEFYKPEYLKQTFAVLETGLARARALEGGSKPWTTAKGRVARAYKSRVDGSLQPYWLSVPESYDPTRPIRLDVVLHGRNATLNEVSFLATKSQEKPIPAEQNFIELEVFGRTNNAYRWSGETDVLEALASVRAQYNINPEQILLRGFSMGGAGTWHLGLHKPCEWAGIEAGAGFNETLRYAKLESAPQYLAPLLTIYDAYLYSVNAYNVPTVGYGGELDPQLAASRNVQDQLAKEGDLASGARTLFLVGPKTEHKFHPDSKAQSEAFLRQSIAQRPKTRNEIRFVTYTLRYPECDWLRLEGLEKHYERAEAVATRAGKLTTVRTRNIDQLAIKGGEEIVLDGQRFEGSSRFEKRDGKWKASARPSKALHKSPGLQGPIDDAFSEAFTTINAPVSFRDLWSKYFRADLPQSRAEDAEAVSRTHNLIVFGEPATSPLVAKLASKLPIAYTSTSIKVNGATYDTAQHYLALIAPNPLNPARYLVLNSGHTFSIADLRGTNARLYPHLPDWAVIRKSDDTVVAAGIFDENWRLAKH
ncbi:MAG TPA: hypothetical protein VE621_22620 [Bryobacteraceae bacterium]|nr:hypothetical protein [Bryobacteraceae bacterium]